MHRFEAFSDAAAEIAGSDTAGRFAQYLAQQPAGSRFDPRLLAGALDLDTDTVADLLEVAVRDDVRLLLESPQVQCPSSQCGTRVDALDLARQEDEGHVPECPDCHREIRNLSSLRTEMRYRFTPEAAAEVTAAQEAAARRPQRSAVLLCAIDDEHDQLRAMLNAAAGEPRGYEPGQGGAVFLTSRFAGQHIDWSLKVAITGQTNAYAAKSAATIMASDPPDLIFFIGIAGGTDDVALGDVVIADVVHDYEVGKETDKGFQARPLQEKASTQMLNWARALRGDPRWRERILVHDPALTDPPPRVWIGPIAAGSKVVATTKTEIAARIKTAAPKAMAVEMEGAGFLAAVFDFPNVEGLLVRGISDLLEAKADSDEQGWRHQAAANAVAFVFEVLSQYKPLA